MISWNQRLLLSLLSLLFSDYYQSLKYCHWIIFMGDWWGKTSSSNRSQQPSKNLQVLVFKAAIAKVLLCLRVDSCSHSNDLHVLSVDGFKCLISVHHCAEDHRFLGGWCRNGDPHPRSRQHWQNFVLLDVSNLEQFDDFVPLWGSGPGAGALETQVILGDIKHSVADVVCRCLPVSVDEAAAPASLTHCQRALTLWQVKHLMKSSSLGAVVSPSIFIPTDTHRSCCGEAASAPSSYHSSAQHSVAALFQL